MNKICHDIFKAIHEGKWLKIEYRNKDEEITKFWIGILDIDVRERKLFVDGLHLSKYTLGERYRISIDQIISSEVVEGSYCAINKKLVEDIYLNPHNYKTLFENTANLKILNYLEMCNRMDTTPYHSDFSLIKKLDRDSFNGEAYQLSEEQFRAVVKNFQYKTEANSVQDGKLKIQQLAMNVLSIRTGKGLYVLAYRKLELDVKRKILRPSDEITICTEYILGEFKESIRKYLDADDFDLLMDFEKNQEIIKDRITKHSQLALGVDDMPYIIGLGMDVVIDLHKEYQAIIKMYQEGNVTVPIKAFFGDLLARPRRSKEYPIALINSNINLDQLLAIHNGMKYPLAYIQGPPGTGKTNTIINTIVTAFFNERTVLFASYNNHPINGVFEKLTNMLHKGKRIPFPVLRLGNVDKVREAIDYIKEVYQQVENIKVYEETLDRRKDNRALRAKQLSDLLKKYEEVLELKDRKDAIQQVMDYQKKNPQSIQMLPFQTDLQGRQLEQVKQKIDVAGEITDEQAIALVNSDYEQLREYLYYMSARYIKKLGSNQYKDLYKIIFEEKKETQLESFSKFLRYVYKNGESHVTQKKANSRALGVKPFSTATEEAFLENLSHALSNIWLSQNKYSIQKEVAISQVFQENVDYNDLFYMGRFDFVVYERRGKQSIPVLAIELDGKEHFSDEVVMNRDRKKNAICEAHNLEIIRVENSYARRYNHIKEILLNYFSVRH